MQVSGEALIRKRQSRPLGYAVLALLVLAPVVAFIVLGLDASSFRLEGAGGPLIAFSAGILSFLSPCVLPLVPIYITHLAGASVENGVVVADRRKTFSHAVAFIVGLSAVFVTLGASVGLAGFFVRDHQRDLEQGAGLMMILLGALLVPVSPDRSARRSVTLLAALALTLIILNQLADLAGSPVRALLLVGAFALLWARASGYLVLNVFSRTVQLIPGSVSARATHVRRWWGAPSRPAGRPAWGPSSEGFSLSRQPLEGRGRALTSCCSTLLDSASRS